MRQNDSRIKAMKTKGGRQHSRVPTCQVRDKGKQLRSIANTKEE
jgi:hypothetical protein